MSQNQTPQKLTNLTKEQIEKLKKITQKNKLNQTITKDDL